MHSHRADAKRTQAQKLRGITAAQPEYPRDKAFRLADVSPQTMPAPAEPPVEQKG